MPCRRTAESPSGLDARLHPLCKVGLNSQEYCCRSVPRLGSEENERKIAARGGCGGGWPLHPQMMKASSSTVASPTTSNARATGSCSSQIRMVFFPVLLHRFEAQPPSVAFAHSWFPGQGRAVRLQLTPFAQRPNSSMVPNVHRTER